MDAIKRRKEMLEVLIQHGFVNTIDMAEMFRVTTMTIRRDFANLAEEGIVTLKHGGAVLNSGRYTEHPALIKQEQMREEKIRIGKFCANLVNEGDSVCLDTGSTVKCVADAIVNKKNVMAITNSLCVVESLKSAKDLKLIMTPGVYREKSLGFLGEMTCGFIEGFQCDTLFLACEGISAKNGASVPDIDEGQTKRAFVGQAKKTVIVADHTKIGKESFMTVASLKQINTLVTNVEADPEAIEKIKEQGVEVFLV